MENPSKALSEASERMLIHPALQHLSWNEEMAKTNAMALDPKDYLMRMQESKKRVLKNLKTKMSHVKMIPTIVENPNLQKASSSSELHYSPDDQSIISIFQPEKFSIESKDLNFHVGRSSGSIQSQHSSGTSVGSIDYLVQKRDVSTIIESRNSKKHENVSFLPLYSLGLSNLFARANRDGKKIRMKPLLRRMRTFTNETEIFTESRSNTPSLHQSQKMHSDTDLNDSLALSSFSGSSCDRAGSNASMTFSIAPSCPRAPNRGSYGLYAVQQSGLASNGQSEAPTAACVGFSSEILSASLSKSTRKNQARSSLSANTASAEKNQRNSRGSKLSADFELRGVSFADHRLYFPENKAIVADLEAAEEVYEERFEILRSHAIEKAKAEKENRSSPATYIRQVYICADQPGEDFRIIYDDTPSSKETDLYPTVRKPATCGPLEHSPNKYLDPVIHQLNSENRCGLMDHIIQQERNCQNKKAPPLFLEREREMAPVSEGSSYLNPRPAPKPPVSPKLDQVFRSCNKSANSWPLSFPISSPPKIPLPTPPIQPGTSKRLSREIQYSNTHCKPGVTITTWDKGLEKDRYDIFDRSFQEKPTKKSAKEAVIRFGLATAELRAYAAGSQHPMMMRTGVPIPIRASRETLLSEPTPEEFDQLSIIDERSETRSVVAVARSTQQPENTLWPLKERHSIDIESSQLVNEEMECFPAFVSRRYSEPSAYMEILKKADLCSNLNYGVTLIGTSVCRDQDVFLKKILPLTASHEKNSEKISTLQRRAISLGDLKKPRVSSSRPILQNHGISHYFPDTRCTEDVSDTPVRQKRRSKMRKHQESLLDLEHAAFGGPPHRDIQGRGKSKMCWGSPPGPPPNLPLPPDPPIRSPLRGLIKAPCTPPQPKISRWPSQDSTSIPGCYSSCGRPLLKLRKSPSRQDKSKHGINEIETSVFGKSLPYISKDFHSVTGAYFSRSSGMKPHNAGYVISPLKAKNKEIMSRKESSILMEGVKNEFVCGEEMQDLMDVLKMNAAEISQACQDGLLHNLSVRNHIHKENAEEGLIGKHGCHSFRSDSYNTKRSSSIRDLLRTGWSHKDLHGSPSSGNLSHISDLSSPSKLSVKSKNMAKVVMSSTFMGFTADNATPLTEGEGSPTSGSGNSTGKSILRKLRAKASLDILSRRKSFAENQQGQNLDEICTALASSNNQSIQLKECTSKGSKESTILQISDNSSPSIPPLPKVERLTMTVHEEDLIRYGICPETVENSITEKYNESFSKEKNSQRSINIQETLAKLRGQESQLEPVLKDRQAQAEVKDRSGNRQWFGMARPSRERFRGRTAHKIPIEEGVYGKKTFSDVSGPDEMPVVCRDTLATIENFLLEPKIRRNIRPCQPDIPPRLASQQLSEITKIFAPGKENYGMPGNRRAMEEPSYSSMPKSSGQGYTPIDISKYAKTMPNEALSSVATIMSLVPRNGANKVVQEKSQAIATALPHLRQDSLEENGDISNETNKKLRNIASTSVLKSSIEGHVRPGLKKKKSLGSTLWHRHQHC